MSDHADAIRHFIWNPGPALNGCRTEWDGPDFPVVITKLEQTGDRVTVPQRRKSGKHKKPHYRRPAPKTQPLGDRPLPPIGNAAQTALDAWQHADDLAHEMLDAAMRASAERELNS